METRQFTIRPIETAYAGCRFRSRLEARWAVVFDSLGIEWRYEPEGYTLSGENYLPDFYLPNANVWVEIKPTEPTSRERRLCAALATATGEPALLIYGDVWPGKYNILVYGHDLPPDDEWRLLQGRKCEHPWVGGDSAAFALGDCCAKGSERWPVYNDDIETAFAAARSARFERRRYAKNQNA